MAVRARKKAPARPLDIRDVQTIKHDRVFLLCDRHGDIPDENTAALGLYFRDTRFLSRYELEIDGMRPTYLHSEVDRNYSMLVETTLPVTSVDPTGVETKKNVSVSRHRWLEHGMHETIRVQNFGSERRRVRISLTFGADFLDLFVVRGLKRKDTGKVLDPIVEEDRVTFGCDGLDGVRRELEIAFEPHPKRISAKGATFELRLDPQSATSVEVSILPRAGDAEPVHASHADLEREYSSWRKLCTRFRASNPQLQQYLDRAILDLRMMQTDLDGTPAIDAGVPWFSTLFGRDSLITAYQALGVNPELAKGTLETLARYQGTKVDEWRDEEPGKILHELRVGELAGTGEIPHTPYYGTIDATPLWLLVYGRVWMWTADLAFAERLWPHAERALEWIDTYGDMDGDGYVEYRKHSGGGLDNQGWKDSHDGIVHADGSIPEPPIALVEVQGYVYDAWRQVARVAKALGHVDAAAELEQKAERLKKRFNDDFWMPDEGFYATALDGNKKQVGSISSNAGHCLWSRIVDQGRAARVVRRLLAKDMSSGWGIRTLSSRNPAYDPIGYHTGTVWPHDNSLIAHGMKLMGFDDAANKVVDQLALGGGFFPAGRFPELFCGFDRESVPVPVEYPVACRPQAWATGATLLMVRSYGGIHADAPRRTLDIVRPTLPFWLERQDLIGMRVGDAKLDLTFHAHEGITGCQVIRKHGELDVLIRY
ncbi:MAG TPA: amylo-alpha-1,6-glucosidase [Actinomycetota bacterium]|nr:amylo-alpha-1,6-glucosidase [Actinomycetota bacterium]